ncbi:MAG: lysophospholipid acyltransferase family protein [Candidatus Melainabacteria bacterium]
MCACLRILFFICIARPLLALVMGCNVFGREFLPRGLPAEQFIMVANHNSHLDALALLNLFSLRHIAHVRPVAAGDYFMTNAVVAWFASTCINILPIPRSGITRANNPVTLMAGALEAGQSIILFPEGSRGNPEEMQAFKTGIAHLIKKYPHIPVIPVFMKGMGRCLPKGEIVLIPFFCDIAIGAPLRFDDGDFLSKEAITERLTTAVCALRQELTERFGLDDVHPSESAPHPPAHGAAESTPHPPAHGAAESTPHPPAPSPARGEGES